MRFLIFLNLLFLLLVSVTSAIGQRLTGVVIDAGTQQPLEGVSIRNLRTEAIVYTDGSGNYTLKSESGDVVEVALFSYKKKIVAVPPAINGVSTKRITLDNDVYSLDEVEIKSGFTRYQIDSIQRRATYSLDLNRQKETSFMSPISLIAQNLSQKSKMRWRFQKNFAKWENEKFIETRYTPELVENLTSLNGNTLFQFMTAYPMNPEYARIASELEIKMWILDNYKSWMKKPVAERMVTLPDSIK